MQDKPRRAARDTVRLKRDVARADSTVRALSRQMARTGPSDSMRQVQAELHRTSNAKQDTLNRIRKGAPMPAEGHKSFAKYVDAFDGAALGEIPPSASIPRGNPTPDSLPSAKGRPSLAQTADGTANLGTTAVTKQAGDSRAVSSSGRGPSAPQSFTDDRV